MAVEEARMVSKLLLVLLLLPFAPQPARYATIDKSDTVMGGTVSSKVGMTNVGNNKRRRRRKEAAVAEKGEQMYCCCGDGSTVVAAVVMVVVVDAAALVAAAGLFFVASPATAAAAVVGSTMVGVGKENIVEWEVVVVVVVDDDEASSLEGKWNGGAMVKIFCGGLVPVGAAMKKQVESTLSREVLRQERSARSFPPNP